MNTGLFPLKYIVGSMLFGILLGFFIYLLFFFTFFAILGSLAFLIILIIDKSSRRIALRFLISTAIVLITSYFTIELVFIIEKVKAENVIKNIYEYKILNKSFPKNIGLLKVSKKYNYFVDSSLTNFRLEYREMYGTPRAFNSLDSCWHW
jgi:hypothetical protein